ncbi:MAG: SLC13 family permease [Gammaproteobacteria bacterium]|nr:MAG: SLC13 family permease [Gammaproteobacteria bacterium]
MTKDQIILFTLLGFVFAFLIWGRWRYDIVAFCALLVALIAGVIPGDQAFAGFGHPATVIIALVLIISRGLSNSGAIELLARYVVDSSRSVSAHIGVLAGVGAALSAVMNNVAALALLMPVDMQAAASAKRSPALTLMPLSFATILGGMVTLIGTPPNIIIAAFRAEALGEPYGMFDFAPVGIVSAVVGMLFVMFIGWRLIPADRAQRDTSKELFDLQDYVAEVHVPEGSPVAGKRVRELDEDAEEADCTIVGLVRRGVRLPGLARRIVIEPDDILVIQAGPDAIDKLVGQLGLEYHRPTGKKRAFEDTDLGLVEVVVSEGARIENRSALSLKLPYRHGVTLLGVSRQGRKFRERVRKLEIHAGDVLLLLGPSERLPEAVSWLGCLPLAERGLQLIQRDKAWLAVGVFASAIVVASLGVLSLPMALAVVAVFMVLSGIVPLRQLYDSVEWPVIVLLGSMIPVGGALEAVGGASLIAGGIVELSQGYSAAVVLVLLMVITMTLSDVMNNTATTVIAAPIAVDIASRLNVSPDPFLMAVAVAASAAFLTPIGHKNNTLIMGPGGYRFGDYWRMGLPLEVLILAVGIPTILWVWPL